MLVRGNQCFRDALRVYDSLKEMAKNQVPGAKPLFESLMSFFRKRRRPGEAETTVEQLDEDFHGIVYGTKSGKQRKGVINRAIAEETEEVEEV
jgi:hypothetical protein